MESHKIPWFQSPPIKYGISQFVEYLQHPAAPWLNLQWFMSNWNHGNVTGRINPVQVLGRSGDLDPRNQPASLLQLVTKDIWESEQFPMPFRCLKNWLKSRSREHSMHPFKPILMKSLVFMVKKPSGKLT